MNLFNWKKKEPKLFRYVGIKDCSEFRDNLDRFLILHNNFRNLQKLFTLDELDLMSNKLSDTNPINVKESFIWFDQNEYKEYIKRDIENASLNLERIAGERKISVNEALLNFLYIPDEEKNNLIDKLKNIIRICENDYELKNKLIYTCSILSEKYIEMYGESDYFLSAYFILKVRNFNIWHHNELNLRSISDEFFEYNANFEEDIKNPKIKLKYSALNLQWKIKELNTDIIEIENYICQALDEIPEYNINPIGYDIIKSLFNLGLHYSDINKNKSDFYLNKIDREWSEISNNTVSNYFKKIGEIYLKQNDYIKAKYWFEKGLKLNPKLSVIKLLQKIEKEIKS